MFSSIRTKLLLLMIIANALMVAGMMTLNSIQFSRSFTEYITQLESRRLQPLVSGIAKEYESEQNWDWLRWNNLKFQQMLRQSFTPPEIRDAERPKGPPPGHPPPAGPPKFFDQLSVRDAKTNVILLGRMQSESVEKIWLPVTAQNGETIAYVGFAPRLRINNDFDNVFRQKQQRDLAYIGLLGVLIAAALAVPFSSWLVRPIKKLTHAVQQMASGDLSVSVDEDRQDELGQLAMDFNRLATILEKNLLDRQQWVSDIAHELRTPVAIFMADIEAAQDGVRQVNGQWLENMHQQIERLSRLVNDLHQLSQSDSGTLNYRFETLDFRSLVEAACERAEHAGREQGLRVQCQLPEAATLIRGDDTRLSQLLNNLLQNTLRYTDSSPSQPGELAVMLQCAGKNAILTWQDSSPGVSTTDLGKLFERLYRVDESRSRDSGGAGLGLAIVQNIVIAHEGSIRASHSDLGGVKITMTLPLERRKG